MWRHVELVYERSTHKGATHQVLIYLAGRANESTHSCYPGNDRIAADLRLDKRTVIRAMQFLSKKGDILRITTGSGRGHASTWMLAETYRPKGDIVTPSEAVKGDAKPPFGSDKGDMSPSFQEKGDIESLKGDIVAERVTSDPLKGDMSPPQRNRTEEEKKEREERETHAREKPKTAPAGAGEYERLWYEYTGWWLPNMEEYFRQELGESPRWELLRTAYQRYKARYRASAEGTIDWYYRLLADPNWQPPKRGGRNGSKPAGSNGSGPSADTAARDKAARDSMSDFAALIAQGGK